MFTAVISIDCDQAEVYSYLKGILTQGKFPILDGK